LRYSQAKLELYGLFRVLKAARMYLVRIKDLLVRVDAKYINGMLKNPNIQPNVTINHWIAAIFLFNFEIEHMPGITHAPDGLSCRKPAPENPEEEISLVFVESPTRLGYASCKELGGRNSKLASLSLYGKFQG
jgi:hypothetical protein